MYFDILDEERLALLPYFTFTKAEGLYLASGTALALQIGHRDSIDFDFFIDRDVDTRVLFEKLREVFVGQSITKVQEEKIHSAF